MSVSQDDRTNTRRKGSGAPLPRPVRELICNYRWIHTTLGLTGNSLFLVGSVLFLWSSLQTAGVWLFIVGSAGMLIGSIGGAVVEAEERDR